MTSTLYLSVTFMGLHSRLQFSNKRNIEMVIHLINEGANPSQMIPTGIFGSVLATAATSGRNISSSPPPKLPLSVKQQLSWPSWYPHAKAKEGSLGIVKYLIDQGANPNLPMLRGGFGSALAPAASVDKDFEVIQHLLERGANPNVVLPT